MFSRVKSTFAIHNTFIKNVGFKNMKFRASQIHEALIYEQFFLWLPSAVKPSLASDMIGRAQSVSIAYMSTARITASDNPTRALDFKSMPILKTLILANR